MPITASRAKGFDVGLVAVLDKPDTVPIYAAHDAHQPYEYNLQQQITAANLIFRVMKLREELCDDALAYDLEFED